MNVKKITLMIVGLLFCLCSEAKSPTALNTNLQGGLGVSQTRVIINAGSSGGTVNLHNYGDRPWLIRGRVTTAPGNDKSGPFTITPPLFRMESDGSYMVRVMPQGAQVLPTDRESVFYISFLAIPPSPPPGDYGADEGIAAQVTIGVDTVMKLFYRPQKLAMTSQEAAKKLTFHYTNSQVTVANPTPYWLTLSSLSFNGKTQDMRNVNNMIAPYSEQQFAQEKLPREVSWTVINDYGGNSPQYRAMVETEETS